MGDDAAVAPREGSAFDVIGQVAGEYGVKLDGLSMLLGFLIGGTWETVRPVLVRPDPAQGEQGVETLDGTKLREWLVTYFEATGRARASS